MLNLPNIRISVIMILGLLGVFKHKVYIVKKGILIEKFKF